MSMDEFIDLCILCGCDYTQTVGGVGPVRAFNFIDHNRNIERTLNQIRQSNDDYRKKKKFIIPDNFLYEESRTLFKEPNVCRDRETIEAKLKWSKPDPDALRNYLIEEKGFQENKVSSGLTKLQNC